ncbi:MAG: hypothetical protein ACI3XL_02725 [Eubacteriales bacterium]
MLPPLQNGAKRPLGHDANTTTVGGDVLDAPIYNTNNISVAAILYPALNLRIAEMLKEK